MTAKSDLDDVSGPATVEDVDGGGVPLVDAPSSSSSSARRRSLLLRLAENPGPSASGRLRDFLSAFVPYAVDDDEDGGRKERRSDDDDDDDDGNLDVESFAESALTDAHGEEGGRDLALFFRPAVLRAAAAAAAASAPATSAAKDDGGAAVLVADGDDDGGGAAVLVADDADAFPSSAAKDASASASAPPSPSSPDVRIVAASRLCAYASMLDAFRKFDGGLVDSSGDTGDSSIQLSEWIYGYRVVLRGHHSTSRFAGLNLRTEKEAREAFEDMLSFENGDHGDGGDNDGVDYERWCDYLERREVEGGSELGNALFADRVRVTANSNSPSSQEKDTNLKPKRTAAKWRPKALTEEGGGIRPHFPQSYLRKEGIVPKRSGGLDSELQNRLQRQKLKAEGRRQWQSPRQQHTEKTIETASASENREVDERTKEESESSGYALEMWKLKEELELTKKRHQAEVDELLDRLGSSAGSGIKERKQLASLSEAIGEIEAERDNARREAEELKRSKDLEAAELARAHRSEVDELERRIRDLVGARERVSTVVVEEINEMQRLGDGDDAEAADVSAAASAEGWGGPAEILAPKIDEESHAAKENEKPLINDGAQSSIAATEDRLRTMIRLHRTARSRASQRHGAEISRLRDEMSNAEDRYRKEAAEIRARHESMVSEKDEAHEAERSRLLKSMDEIRAEYDDAKREAERRIREEMDETLTSAREVHKSEVTELKERLSELKEAHRGELSAAREEHESKTSLLKGEIADAERRYRKEAAELRAQHEEMLVEKDEAYGAERTELLKSIEELKAESDDAEREAERRERRMDDELVAIREAHRAEVAKLEVRLSERDEIHRMEVSRLREEAEAAVSAAIREEEERWRKVRDEDTAAAAAAAAIEADRRARQAEIKDGEAEARKREHQANIEQLERRLRELRESHQNESARASEAHEEEMARLKEEAKTIQDRLESEVTELGERLREVERSHRDETSRASKSHESELSKLKEEMENTQKNHIDSIRALEEQLQEREEAYVRERGTLAETLAAVEAARDSARSDLEGLRKAREEELAMAKERHEAEVEALRKRFRDSGELTKEKSSDDEENLEVEHKQRGLGGERTAAAEEGRVIESSTKTPVAKTRALDFGDELEPRGTAGVFWRRAAIFMSVAFLLVTLLLCSRWLGSTGAEAARKAELTRLTVELAAADDGRRAAIQELNLGLRMKEEAHDEERTKLLNTVEKVKANLDAAAREAERREGLKDEMLAEARESHRVEVAELKERISERDEAHRRELSGTKERLEARLKEGLTEQEEAFRKELSRAKEEAEAVVSDATRDTERLRRLRAEDISAAEVNRRTLVEATQKDVEERHRAEMELLKGYVQELRESNQNELARVSEAHAAEVARLKEEAANAQRDRKSEMTKLGEQLKEMETSCRDEATLATKAHRVELSRLKEEMEGAEGRHLAAMRVLNDQLRERIETHERKSGALADTLDAAEAARDAARSDLEGLQKARDEELASAKELHESEVGALREQFRGLEKELSIVRGELEEREKQKLRDQKACVSLASGFVEEQHPDGQIVHTDKVFMKAPNRRRNRLKKIVGPVIAVALASLLVPVIWGTLGQAVRGIAGVLVRRTAAGNNVVPAVPSHGANILVTPILWGAVGPLGGLGVAARATALLGAIRRGLVK